MPEDQQPLFPHVSFLQPQHVDLLLHQRYAHLFKFGTAGGRFERLNAGDLGGVGARTILFGCPPEQLVEQLFDQPRNLTA